MDSSTMKWVALGGCVAMAVGMILPWVSAFGMSVNGLAMGGVGYLILLSGIAGAVFAFAEIKFTVFVAGAGALLLIINILNAGTGIFSMATYGFYITLLGAIASVVGSIPMFKTGKEISALGEMFGGKK